MKRTYKSRISIALVAFMALICFGMPVAFIDEPDITFKMSCITIPIFIIIMIALTGIKYVIDGNTLKIYSFYGIHHDIDIKTITKIEPSHNIMSSPAASLKRLAIHYGKYDVVLISPRNQEDFINRINEIRK